MKPTAFISGHLDLTNEEFMEHYAPKIMAAIFAGHNFVVGDARGADLMAQSFIATHTPVFTITVFHMFDSPRNNPFNYRVNGGYESDHERDKAMTKASTYDIAWVRPGREGSGTAMNLKRRETNG